MMTRNRRVTLRILIAMALSAGLLWNQWPLASSGSALAAVKIKSESQLKSEAGLYDTAIREISRIADLKLSVPENSKTAQSIIDKHGPNLKFGRSKLIVLGSGDSTFASAVKAKGPDTKSLDQFAQDLSKDPNSILKLNGASAVADRIRKSIEADTAKLQKIAELLKQAGADIKAKAHHPVKTRPTLTSSEVEAPVLPQRLTNDAIVLLVVVAAVIVYPPLGLVLINIAAPVVTAVYAAAIVAGAAIIIGRLIENGATEEGRDRVGECQDRVLSKRRRCVSEANDLPYPLNVAAADACYAQWLLDAALCLVA